MKIDADAYNHDGVEVGGGDGHVNARGTMITLYWQER
jgi:hypothetical protein